MRKLRERPRRFIDLYTTPGQPAYLNGTEAAVLAGYGKGNRDHARRHACTLRQVPEVEAKIQEKLSLHERILKDGAVSVIGVVRAKAEDGDIAAAALFLKVAGRLKDVVQHEGRLTLEDLVAESMKPPEPA